MDSSIKKIVSKLKKANFKYWTIAEAIHWARKYAKEPDTMMIIDLHAQRAIEESIWPFIAKKQAQIVRDATRWAMRAAERHVPKHQLAKLAEDMRYHPVSSTLDFGPSWDGLREAQEAAQREFVARIPWQSRLPLHAIVWLTRQIGFIADEVASYKINDFNYEA